MIQRVSLHVGGTLVAVLFLAAIGGPFVVHADPLAVDLAQTLAPPSPQHWLGCDSLGRDMLARILSGARLSLGVSISVVLLAVITGSLVGGAAAIAGGRIDSLVMRGVDIVLAFPGFLLALALAAILGPGLVDLLIALTAMGWTGYARLVRGELLSLRDVNTSRRRARWARAGRGSCFVICCRVLRGPLWCKQVSALAALS